MRKVRSLKAILASSVVLAMVVALSLAWSGAAVAAPQNGRYFVGFHGLPEAAVVHAAGGEIVHAYDIIPAFAATLSPAAAEALRNNPKVAYVEADGVCHALADSVPWGISRVEADVVQAGGNYGAGIKVAVIDTGIDIHHTDLLVAGGYSCVDYTTSYDDDAGHGSHVAGTIAALANGSGIIGCAPQVSLYAVKVLDSGGSGTWTDVVEGIDWARANGMDIINMSLGGSTGLTALELACNNAYNAGVLIVCAAGNSGNSSGTGDNVGYPARYDSCIAVAATDSNDIRAYFSSTGPAVELAAPGVSIYSTYYNGGYTTMSGTSMASPHVAGVAALVMAANPTFANVDVRNAMNSTAIDLGDPGRDVWYGYGLVNAPLACSGGGPVPALTVDVSTNKSTYVMGETVVITTLVTDQAGAPVGGAAVTLTVRTPKNKTKTFTGTTGTDGRFVYNYTPKVNDGKGTYNVTASATKTGYNPGLDTCSFVMQ